MKNIKKALSKAAISGAAVAKQTASTKNLNMVKNVIMSNPKLISAIARRAGVGDIVDSVMPMKKSSSALTASNDVAFAAPGSNVPLYSTPVTSLSRAGLHLREVDTTAFIVSDGSGFQIFSFQINPTNQDLFPKAAQIAGKFNRWRLNRLRLTFQPTVGTGMSTSSSLGTVCLASTDDPNDVSPNDMIQVANLPSKTQSVIYNKCALDFRSSGTLLYTGGNDNASNVSDLRFSSCGVYYAAIDYSPIAFPAGSKMGMLVCDYDLELSQFLLSVNTPYATQPTGSYMKLVLDAQGGTFAGYHNLSQYYMSVFTTAALNFSFTLQPGLYLWHEWVDQDGAAPSTGAVLVALTGDVSFNDEMLIPNYLEGPTGSGDIFEQATSAAIVTGRRTQRAISVNSPSKLNWSITADSGRTLEFASIVCLPVLILPGFNDTVSGADQMVDFPPLPLSLG